MRHYTANKNFLILMILSMLVVITLYSASLKAGSFTSNENLTGVWAGVIEDKEKGKVKLDLRIKPARDKSSSYEYELNYGTPRSCTLETEELSVEAGIITLKFTGASDLKFCFRLYKDNGSMTITVNADHLIVLIETFPGKYAKYKETVTLKKH